MSKKRKLLLFFTIAIIVISYGIALKAILNHSGTPRQSRSVDKAENRYSGYQSNANRNRNSPYRGNQLPNGTSPFDACFGRGVFNGEATLTIKNGASTDAIVCLYSLYLGRTIRNVYVQKNTSFTMEGIGEGNYKIRVFYGNDWNPGIENPCGIKGYFESDVHFSEFDGTQYFEDNYESYTIATVTLYTVSGGNASTSRINQAEFFGN